MQAQASARGDRGPQPWKGLAAPLDGAAHDIGDADEIAARRERSRFDTRHIEQIAHEPRQAIRLLLDGNEKILPVPWRHIVSHLTWVPFRHLRIHPESLN